MNTYYYIKHGEYGPINITFSGLEYGYGWSEGDGFNFGIKNITQFPRRKDAVKVLHRLRKTFNLHSKHFKLIKVICK